MEAIRIAIASLLHDHKALVLAKKMGLNISTLYKWGEVSTENTPHSNIPLDKAIQLTLVAGDGRVMDAIAAEAGGTFVPGHQLVGCKFESERAAMRVMHDAADLIGSYTDALEDNRVTVDEYKEILKAQTELVLAASAIAQSAREKAGL